MTQTGKLVAQPFSEAGLDRVTTAIEAFAVAIADAEVAPDQVRAVGTAAARTATNPEVLVDLVRSKLGVALELLDGQSEARLSFLGAAAGLGPHGEGEGRSGPLVTIDIGGGSTEIAFGTSGEVSGLYSIPIGGSLLAATYLESDPPKPEELSAALSVVELHLDDVRREVEGFEAALEDATVVVLGAASTIAAIEVGDNALDANNGEGDGPYHGFELGRDAVEDVFRTIATESRQDRAHNPGLPATRVDDIVGATIVLVETMRQFDLRQVIVSQRGLSDGVAIEMTDDL